MGLRVGVVGAGAVGLGLATCLHAGSLRPALAVRDADRRAELAGRGFARSGLFGRVEVPAGAFDLAPSASALAREPLDALLVCTKTTAGDAVAAELAAAGRGGPPIVLCQNGWGQAERFAARLPRARVFSARIITGFRLRGPREVEITVHAQPMTIGSLFGASAEPLRWLCDAIAKGGLPCELSPSIERDLLAKLLYNCALNPLAALRGVPYGALAEPESRAVVEAIVAEVFAVLHAAGRETHWPDATAYLDALFSELLPPTRTHEPSMLHDLRAGRATEIDALCGAVVALGRQAGVAAPVNAALTTLIHAAERLGARH